MNRPRESAARAHILISESLRLCLQFTYSATLRSPSPRRDGSPDSKQLAFLSDRDDQTQINAMLVRHGEAVH